MKLLADECIDEPIVARLREEGYQVEYVRELNPGITDEEVLNRAHDADALLLTGDKDFGELIYRLGRASCGVVLVRLAGVTNEHKAELVSAAFAEKSSQFLGAFTVISPGMVRVRPSLAEDPTTPPTEEI